MRIVSLEPFLTELVISLGLGESLVGISGGHDFSTELGRTLPIVSEELVAGVGVASELSTEAVDIGALKATQPDIVLTQLPGVVAPAHRPGAGPRPVLTPCTPEENALREALGNDKVRLVAVHPLRLEDIFQMVEEVAVQLGVGSKGREKSQRMQAQFMDWGDNFYERCKNKRVTFLASVKPLKLGGFWISDMIAMASGVSQEGNPGQPHREIAWSDVVEFRPDVIVLAPQGVSLKENMKGFHDLVKLPGWDDVPAVKRGEVIFTDGEKFFYRPSPRLIDSMGVLISAIAGFESGYITERDSFFRLRWLELNRHKL